MTGGGLPRCAHGAPVWACNAAPAGLPLHEPTDRDADNVPSDRVRDYAEAVHDVVADHPMWIGDDSQPLDYNPDRDARIVDFTEETARAVMAVADREQATAWDEGYRFGRLMQFDADHHDAPKWPTHNSRASLVANLDSAERNESNHDNPYRAASRGPEPTEDCLGFCGQGRDPGACPSGCEPTED